MMQDALRRYRREQELMLSAIHNLGMKNIRQKIGAPQRTEKTSFLNIERTRVSF